ncbi:putative PPE family protein PPE47/PPE48 [Mycobacterium basiliense]|uniref:Putative PPE family protein PPE47/PPE48 n=1 Tax=Mycobacterium basiliense TaxID=2094119 RepID=A0A3S4FMY8_9MYCO|nr:PPE domain-containing protein [Mycobacterium basiliense]VDM88862.1 putative PPE family protein PPE47/PPE48 [Mycobacterium basiliense]
MAVSFWAAWPPEVHSALLSTGAGPGPLLSAATEWKSLGDQHARAVSELEELLGWVHAGVWEGRGADGFAAACAAYLAWLTKTTVDYLMAAALLETTAAAYVSALAMMPTLAELTENQEIRTVLVATNFFGVNTGLIALNEAHYAAMWERAATAMTVYEATCTAAVAAAPPPLGIEPVVGQAHAEPRQAMRQPFSPDSSPSPSPSLGGRADNGPMLGWDEQELGWRLGYDVVHDSDCDDPFWVWDGPAELEPDEPPFALNSLAPQRSYVPALPPRPLPLPVGGGGGGRAVRPACDSAIVADHPTEQHRVPLGGPVQTGARGAGAFGFAGTIDRAGGTLGSGLTLLETAGPDCGLAAPLLPATWGQGSGLLP